MCVCVCKRVCGCVGVCGVRVRWARVRFCGRMANYVRAQACVDARERVGARVCGPRHVRVWQWGARGVLARRKEHDQRRTPRDSHRRVGKRVQGHRPRPHRWELCRSHSSRGASSTKGTYTSLPATKGVWHLARSSEAEVRGGWRRRWWWYLRKVPSTSYAVEAGDGRDAVSGGSASRHTVKLFCFFWSNMLT